MRHQLADERLLLGRLADVQQSVHLPAGAGAAQEGQERPGLLAQRRRVPVTEDIMLLQTELHRGRQERMDRVIIAGERVLAEPMDQQELLLAQNGCRVGDREHGLQSLRVPVVGQ